LDKCWSCGNWRALAFKDELSKIQQSLQIHRWEIFPSHCCATSSIEHPCRQFDSSGPHFIGFKAAASLYATLAENADNRNLLAVKWMPGIMNGKNLVFGGILIYGSTILSGHIKPWGMPHQQTSTSIQIPMER
jgi:hypothetical protein